MGHYKVITPFALMLFAACGSRGGDDELAPVPSPVTCESDADCAADQICLYGSCVSVAPDQTDDYPDSTATTTSTSTWASTAAPTSTSDSTDAPPDVYGVWYGYVEGFEFSSGSDVLRLEISEGDCSPTATLTLGEGEPPPPATDGSVGYPEESDTLEFGFGQQWYEGYTYQATNVEIGALRVQMDVSSGQLWQGWCELQTVYETEGSYGCLPNWGGGGSSDGECHQVSPDGETVERDCGQLSMCLFGTCQCEAEGCDAESGSVAQLDVALDDGSLEGVLTGFGSVRFYR